MHYTRNTVYTFLFLLLVLALWLFFVTPPQPAQVTLAAQTGIVDLRDANFTDTVYQYRDNGWQHYPEALLTPSDFAADNDPEPISTRYVDFRTVQYATHRVQLRLPPGQLYALRMKSTDYAMRLYIDDTMADAVGNPGETTESNLPSISWQTYYFQPTGDLTTILVQSANGVHREGALVPDFTLGTAANIDGAERHALMMTFLISGVLIAMFLYHLGLFAVNRRRVVALAFALYCLLLTIKQSNLPQIFDLRLSWYAVFRLEHVVFAFSFAMLCLFLRLLFPRLLNRYVVMVYLALAGLYIFLTFLCSPRVTSTLLIGFEAVSALMLGYAMVRLGMQLRERKLQNLLAFVGMLLVCLFTLINLLYTNGLIFLGNIPGQFFTSPIAMCFFVFCYAQVVALEYAETEYAYANARQQAQIYAEESAMLGRLNALKSEFLGNISHVLKTPLTVLSSQAQLARQHEEEKSQPDAYIIEKTVRAVSEVERLAVMVTQLSDIARIEEQGLEWHFGEVDAAALIQETLDTFYPVLNKNHNVIEARMPEDSPRLWCDAERVKQVLLNLLSNAIRFTRHGVITVSLREEDDQVAIIVADTGKGIAAEKLPFLFDRYYSEGRGTLSTGVGLGLFITRLLVEGQGGEISVESEVDKGSIHLYPALCEARGGACG